MLGEYRIAVLKAALERDRFESEPYRDKYDCAPPQARGSRPAHARFNGELLDVRTAAALIGMTEKLIRSRVERRRIPFRRLGGRIVFLRDELTAYEQALPGCGLDEALKNLEQRTEASG